MRCLTSGREGKKKVFYEKGGGAGPLFRKERGKKKICKGEVK